MQSLFVLLCEGPKLEHTFTELMCNCSKVYITSFHMPTSFTSYASGLSEILTIRYKSTAGLFHTG